MPQSSRKESRCIRSPGRLKTLHELINRSGVEKNGDSWTLLGWVNGGGAALALWKVWRLQRVEEFEEMLIKFNSENQKPLTLGPQVSE